MSKEVTEIINTLCEKLGVAANILVPELAKYNIARLAFQTLVGVVLLIVAIVIVTKIVKYVLNEADGDVEDIAFNFFLISLFPALIIVPLYVLTVNSATNLIGWIISPTASAVMEITSMIK